MPPHASHLSPETQEERILIAELVRRPQLLTEFQPIGPNDLFLPEMRVILKITRIHRDRSARRGKLSFASADAIDRIARDLLDTKTDDEQARTKNETILRLIQDFIDETRSWPMLSQEEFDDHLDRAIDRATEFKIRTGLLKAADQLRAGQLASAVDVVRQLTANVTIEKGPIRATLASDAKNALAEYYDRKLNPSLGRFATFDARINDITGGGQYGRLWLPAAYAKDGKTMFGVNCIYAASIQQGAGAVIVTNEQTAKDVRNALVVRHSHQFIAGGISFKRFMECKLFPEEEKAFEATVHDLETNKARGPIHYIQTSGGTTIGDVSALLESVAQEQAVDVAMIDHTLLFEPTRRAYNPVERITNVLQELKRLALDFQRGRGLWVLAPHQINREGKKAADERGYYMPHDLAAGAEAERSADVVAWLWRNQDLRDNGEIRLGVCVNRYGRIEAQGWEVCERFDGAALIPLAP